MGCGRWFLLVLGSILCLGFIRLGSPEEQPAVQFLPTETDASAVTAAKQKRTVSAARSYILKNSKSKHSRKQPRMDVIEVYLSKTSHKLIKLNHITDAFGAD